MDFKLNIFTYCDGIYKDFIPLFILSNISNNNDCFVEIAVDDNQYSKIESSLSILNEQLNDKFLVYQKDNSKIPKSCKVIPNTIRFLLTPKIKTPFVYISDIDIINLEENIVNIHIDNMKRTGLPYSNIVRKSSNRLSGLHFTTYSNYYPIPNYDDLCERNLLHHDEVFLFELVKKRHPKFNLDETFRPVHGIHVSLNREPTAVLGWGMNRWEHQWKKFRNTKIFLDLEPTLTDMIKNKIEIIDNFYK